ncbi:hypothetical protein BJ508DRAFT_148884 [Ascobolus immersus RN42]|uniref:F-box domain-containing protein n=1 Tax=Ascobolus immersus RN42 TaxID=1160509 RepID=A0A3N4IJG6_ASCIM|nr:hypothetical protein BJ508DRAFT_148884 [Ascobolus immersus RN42]
MINLNRLTSNVDMPQSPASVENRSSFLCLPYEIRFEVYRQLTPFTILQLSLCSNQIRMEVNNDSSLLRRIPEHRPSLSRLPYQASRGHRNITIRNIPKLHDQNELELFGRLGYSINGHYACSSCLRVMQWQINDYVAPGSGDRFPGGTHVEFQRCNDCIQKLSRSLVAVSRSPSPERPRRPLFSTNYSGRNY